MKFLVFLFSALAAVSAAYYGPQHIPVIGPNGVPIEPQEVQAARASHLAALASAHGGLIGGGSYYAPSVPFTAFSVPTLGQNALPLDTPEVASAKLQHLQNFALAAQRNGVQVPLLSSTPLLGLAGAHPLDTPEVQLAKAAHFQAHAQAAARAGPALYFGHSRKRRSIYGGYHIPVIGPNGVPVETPEVQAAKANHFAALAAASSKGGFSGYNDGSYSGAYNSGAYAEPYRRYYGPQATIGPNGHPVETPEVQAATAYHLAAHAAVRSGSHLGVPGHYY